MNSNKIKIEGINHTPSGLTTVDIENTKSILNILNQEYVVHNLNKLNRKGIEIKNLPYSIRALLDNALHSFAKGLIAAKDIENIAKWPRDIGKLGVPFKPSRIILQDLMAIPVLVDLALIRKKAEELPFHTSKINPVIPIDIVIDHSLQVDDSASSKSQLINLELEYKRNNSRYGFLKWASQSFDNINIVPPGSGIIHQINLEYLSKLVYLDNTDHEKLLGLESCLGTDSHTPMINSIGVIGWGIGGIEAISMMLGNVTYINLPEVVGIKLIGKVSEGTTTTDIALTIVNILRKRDVVGKFVEFIGSGVKHLSIPDRAIIANMCPEYGSTMAYFPIDSQTIEYLLETGRTKKAVCLVECYVKSTMLFRQENDKIPTYTETIKIDISEIKSTISGPSRPDQSNSLTDIVRISKQSVHEYLTQRKGSTQLSNSKLRNIEDRDKLPFSDGQIVIAAITSCTNTSNPGLMIGAGLLAKKAVELGLATNKYVKTSFAPGSKVVTDYLSKAGLLSYLENLGFHVVGYGCTTCIGNSGPLNEDYSSLILSHNIYCNAILSGNRNFGGRIHHLVKGNYLASPLLVIAYAIIGRLDVNLLNEPIGRSPVTGEHVYLTDIWPSNEEIKSTVSKFVKVESYRSIYGKIRQSDHQWQKLRATEIKNLLDFQSSYIRIPPFMDHFSLNKQYLDEIGKARVLVLAQDNITTDHISPAGRIDPNSSAGKFLSDMQIKNEDFNTYGSRRGNYEIMVRGTFANPTFQNQLCMKQKGPWTKLYPEEKLISIFEASEEYRRRNVPLIIIVGKNYGTGSSRDWAARGVLLLGVRAVIFESIERIHRSNLIGMGILPLQFCHGANAQTLEITGNEKFNIKGLTGELMPKQSLRIEMTKRSGIIYQFDVILRADLKEEIEILQQKGILNYSLLKLIGNYS